MRRARPGALALLAALALALAGCGGGGDTTKANAYVDSVNIVQARLASGFSQIKTGITTSSTPARDRRTLRGISELLDTTVADLRAITPPSGVGKLHGELVDELAAYSDAVATAEKALGGNVAATSQAETQLAEATKQAAVQVNTTIAAINRKLRE